MVGVVFNWPAILVAAVASIVLGWLWYSPFLFGELWMRKLGRTKEQVQAEFSPLSIVLAFVLGAVMAVFLTAFLHWTRTTTAVGGAYIGLCAGIGFSATTFAVNDTFEKRPVVLWLVNAMFHVIVLVAMGAILGAWR